MAIKLAPETFAFPEVAAPGTPDTGYVYVYAKSDGKMYRKDDTGTETELGGGSSNGDFPEPITGTFTIASGFSRTESNVQIASGGELVVNGSLYIV